MRKCIARAHISWLSRTISNTSPIACFQQLASVVCRKLPLLDDATCLCAEDALRQYQYEHPLFRTPEILTLASDLPRDHPGWRLLALMVERTGFDRTLGSQENTESVLDWEVPAAVERLARIKNRLIGGEFTTMRPFAIVVWITSRQKITAHCEDLAFPPEWKQIMLDDTKSPALSFVRNVTRYLLPGDVERVWMQSHIKT